MVSPTTLLTTALTLLATASVTSAEYLAVIRAQSSHANGPYCSAGAHHYTIESFESHYSGSGNDCEFDGKHVAYSLQQNGAQMEGCHGGYSNGWGVCTTSYGANVHNGQGKHQRCNTDDTLVSNCPVGYCSRNLGLDLADPGDVVLPKPQEAPVPYLSTVNGLICGVDGLSANSSLVPQPQKLPEPGIGYSSRELGPSGVSLPDISNWSTEDLSLLENFSNSTYSDMGHDPASGRLWQAVVPPLAHQHNFLKHGLLAVSALHRAYLDPSQKQRYQMVSARHQNKCLPLFRSSIGCQSETNSNALLTSAQLLVIHVFASDEQNEDLLLVKGGARDKGNSGLPDWLQLIRGSCTIFQGLMLYVANGPFKKLADEMKAGYLDALPEKLECKQRLEQLSQIPSNGPPPRKTAHKEPPTRVLRVPGAAEAEGPRGIDFAGPLLHLAETVGVILVHEWVYEEAFVADL
ncbi:hypothetical protein V501_01491 [Pseudogymnoascus sp. VKM F-4519 (FW-2642)]|nr:hypothetical protein V501_01491 [Pseudogymnoascus sp. VKM F-4519 (FW-2642)]